MEEQPMNARRDKLVAETLGWRHLGGDHWLSPDEKNSRRRSELRFCSDPTPETNWMCQQWLREQPAKFITKVENILVSGYERRGFEVVEIWEAYFFFGDLDDLANAIADVLEEQK